MKMITRINASTVSMSGIRSFKRSNSWSRNMKFCFITDSRVWSRSNYSVVSFSWSKDLFNSRW